MAQRNGSNTTERGLELRRQHDAQYKKMLIGKKNNVGTIINAEWVGNSVYGIVKVFFEDGSDKLYGHKQNGFRPRKEDFNLIETEK